MTDKAVRVCVWTRRMTDKPVRVFVCASCGDEFETTWTDDEAEAEYRALWPDFKDAERELICDDCFKRLMGTLCSSAK